MKVRGRKRQKIERDQEETAREEQQDFEEETQPLAQENQSFGGVIQEKDQQYLGPEPETALSVEDYEDWVRANISFEDLDLW